MDDKINIGELNDWIEIGRVTKIRTSTGAVSKSESAYKNTWSKSVDVSSTETDGEKIYLVNVRKYIIRFDPVILDGGEEMFINDIDGKYQVIGIRLMGKRRDFMELKTEKRE